MTANKSDEAKARAEANFRKNEQRSHERQQVYDENAAKARAVDQKTARLKALRLAREAETLSEPKGGHAPASKSKRAPKLIANPDEVKGG